MSSQPRDIPGFYYDSERQKYFRIQANHQKPPLCTVWNPEAFRVSKYTRQAVNAANLHARESQGGQSKDDRKRAENLQRSHLLTHPVHNLDLRHRLGNRKPVGDFVRRQYAWMLRPNTVMAFGKPGQKFAVEEGSKALFTTAEVESRGRAGGMREMCVTPLSQPQEQEEGEEPTGNQSPRYESSKTVPILNAFQATIVLPLSERFVMWSYRQPDDMDETQSVLCISKKYADDSVPWQDWREEFGEWGTTARQTSSVIWDFAVPRICESGASQPASFALATSNGVKIYDFEYGANGLSDIRNRGRTAESERSGEPLVVTFKDQNVFMAGARSGSVAFGDVRVKSSVTRLDHGNAVTGLRRLRNENLVLVNGLKTMAVYDLRYPGSCTGKKKRKHKRLDKNVLEFEVPESMQQKRYGLGFDYDEELNIVASACTDFDTKHKVGLWDCGTGKRIEDGALAKRDFQEPVTCLQMTDLREQGQSSKSILTKSGGIIEEWHV